MMTNSLKSQKLSFLKLSFLILLCLSSMPQECELSIVWSLQPRQPPILMSPESSLALVRKRSSIASPLCLLFYSLSPLPVQESLFCVQWCCQGHKLHDLLMFLPYLPCFPSPLQWFVQPHVVVSAHSQPQLIDLLRRSSKHFHTGACHLLLFGEKHPSVLEGITASICSII